MLRLKAVTLGILPLLLVRVRVGVGVRVGVRVRVRVTWGEATISHSLRGDNQVT